MKCNIYAIYDKVAQCAMPPFTARNDAEAVRMFDNGLQQAYQRNPNSANPSDFDVLHVGYWSDDPVGIVAVQTPIAVNQGYVFTPREAPNA